MITDAKRKYLEDVFGKEEAARILEDLENKGKALEEIGVSHKSAKQPPAVVPVDPVYGVKGRKVTVQPPKRFTATDIYGNPPQKQKRQHIGNLWGK